MFDGSDLATQNAFLIEENKRLRTERTELKREMKGMASYDLPSSGQSGSIARLQDENQALRTDLECAGANIIQIIGERDELQRQIDLIDMHISEVTAKTNTSIDDYETLITLCEREAGGNDDTGENE